jgi:hypothetical protein
MREKRNGTNNLLGWCPRRCNEALCPKWSEAEWRGNVLEWIPTYRMAKSNQFLEKMSNLISKFGVFMLSFDGP